MKTSRRHMMKTIASILGFGVIGQDATGKSINCFDTINRYYSKNNIVMDSTYLCIPGASFTTLFSNLPVLLSSHGPNPTILMDRYDYDRLRSQIHVYPNDMRMQYLTSITDMLIRRGDLQTIDYASYYSIEKQDRYLDRFWEAQQQLPDHVADTAARNSIDGHLGYRRGDYQKQFRRALGNWDVNTERRKGLRQQHRRFDSGSGDPETFNENIWAQYIAALEIRHTLNSETPHHIDGVLGDGDSRGIATILRETNLDIDSDVISLGSDGQTIEQVGHPTPSHPAQRHKLINSISKIAQETTGVQDNDWYMLGANLAVPTMTDLSITNVRNEVTHRPSAVAHEAKEIIAELRTKSNSNTSSSMSYEAEKIAEEITTTDSHHDIEKQLNRAADLSNYSDDLRALGDDDHYSQAALMIAASVLMDPQWRASHDDLYQKAQKLQHRTATLGDEEIEFFRDRNKIRRDDGTEINWYQQADRQRA